MKQETEFKLPPLSITPDLVKSALEDRIDRINAEREKLTREMEGGGDRIDLVELSVRARTCLDKLGVTTLESLLSKTESDLISVKGSGRMAVNDIKHSLDRYALQLSDSIAHKPIYSAPVGLAELIAMNING